MTLRVFLRSIKYFRLNFHFYNNFSDGFLLVWKVVIFLKFSLQSSSSVPLITKFSGWGRSQLRPRNVTRNFAEKAIEFFYFYIYPNKLFSHIFLLTIKIYSFKNLLYLLITHFKKFQRKVLKKFRCIFQHLNDFFSISFDSLS